FQIRYGLIEPMQRQQRQRPIDKREQTGGIQRERPVKISESLLCPSEAVEHASNIVEDVGIVRGKLERFAGTRKGLLRPLQPQQAKAPQLPCSRKIRPDLEQEVEACDRLLMTPLVEMQHCTGARRAGVMLIELQRLIETHDRFIGALLQLQHLAHPEPGLGLM